MPITLLTIVGKYKTCFCNSIAYLPQNIIFDNNFKNKLFKYG
jgi:hypothetical protein